MVPRVYLCDRQRHRSHFTDCVATVPQRSKIKRDHFIPLLAEKDSSKNYFYHDLEGKDCIIGCLDRENYQKLREFISKVRPHT